MMWTDTHLVEGDMEARVDLKARMDSRLREAEQWRMARMVDDPEGAGKNRLPESILAKLQSLAGLVRTPTAESARGA
jgi:hypothetical protein